MKKVIFEFGFKVLKLSKCDDKLTFEIDDENAPYPAYIAFDATVEEAKEIAEEILKLIKSK